MNVLSLFSGIGAFEKALGRLNVPYNLVAYCEIDKYASRSYSAIHGISEEKNLCDVRKVNKSDISEHINLITYGFPCQDISVAGKQKGFYDEEGNVTRSGLFFEAARIINEFKPEFSICENVKALTSKRFSEEFKTVLQTLSDIGYENYYAVLNAKDYGIPQNRERVFIVSIRKDIDHGFCFPEKQELKIRVKNLLESFVDEKYYLHGEKVEQLISQLTGISEKECCDLTIKNPKCKDIANTVMARTDRGVSNIQSVGSGVAELRQIGQLYGTEREKNPLAGRIYDPNGISQSIRTPSGGNTQPIFVVNAENDGTCRTIKSQYFKTSGANLVRKTSMGATGIAENSVIVASRGRNPENPSDRTAGNYVEQRLEPKTDGCSNTLTSVQKDNMVLEKSKFRIRKLTPKECFRLMGFDDEDFEKAEKVNSNTQLYKQAGNSIVVNVLEEIFRQLSYDYAEFLPF